MADTFLIHVKTEIEKRRPTDLVHLMEYLHDRNYIKAAKRDPFGFAPSKAKIVDLASSLLNRLYYIEDEDTEV